MWAGAMWFRLFQRLFCLTLGDLDERSMIGQPRNLAAKPPRTLLLALSIWETPVPERALWLADSSAAREQPALTKALA